MKILKCALVGLALILLSSNSLAVDIARFPIAGLQAIVACSGEIWTAEGGEVQLLSREHVDGQGKLHVTYRLQLVNVWGTTNLGNIYRGTGNGAVGPYDWTTIMAPEYPPAPDTGPVVLRHNISSRLVPVRGSDGVPSFAITRVKITVNANGVKVVDTELHEIRCPGSK